MRGFSAWSPGSKLSWALTALSLAGCGPGAGAERAASATSEARAQIEKRTFSGRPPLAVVERYGDAEAALGFASLAGDTPEAHADFGALLVRRLERAGFVSELSAHGLGFEVSVLLESPGRARAAVLALRAALESPVTSGELPELGVDAGAGLARPRAVDRCSGSLADRRRVRRPLAELERERVNAFAVDRTALSVVGPSEIGATVDRALSEGADWPERGAVVEEWPSHGTVEAGDNTSGPLRLSVALRVASPDAAVSAASELGRTDALPLRLAAPGVGFKLERVAAVAHPLGACLRLDASTDGGLATDPAILAHAVRVIEQEANSALRAPPSLRFAEQALAAMDPRRVARAVAYQTLVRDAGERPTQRLVAVGGPVPFQPAALQAALSVKPAAPGLETRVRMEVGQPGFWALLSVPCAAALETVDTAGQSALLMTALAAAGSEASVRLEPWLGSDGVGIIGFAAVGRGASAESAAAKLGEALGRSLLAAPSATEVASARSALLSGWAASPRPGLRQVLDTLVPGRAGALMPRGTFFSLEAVSRERAQARQRELYRLPHRLRILSAAAAGSADIIEGRIARYLEGPTARAPSPCLAPPAPADPRSFGLSGASSAAEGSYVAFRLFGQNRSALEAVVEWLNGTGGPLERALAEPQLVGAARAGALGGRTALALVVQVSAFGGREAEALARITSLFDRLARGAETPPAELERVLARQRAGQRNAALDPHYRLISLFDDEASPAADLAAVRQLLSTLRAESAVVARANVQSGGT